MSTFADVGPDAQFAREIEWMASTGISTGYDQGGKKVYRPLDPVNRDAMAAFLYRLAGTPPYPAPLVSPFTDVPRGSQFYAEICWLADQGISTGYADATYRPLAPVSREAMAAFMYRFARSPWYAAPTSSPFTDVATSSLFYTEICWLSARGISTGWPDRTYRPGLAVARDAMAAFMYRLRSMPSGESTAAVLFDDATDANLTVGFGHPYAAIRGEDHHTIAGSTFETAISVTLFGADARGSSDHPVPIGARRLTATVAHASATSSASVRFEVVDAASGAVVASARVAPGTTAEIAADVSAVTTARLRATAADTGASTARWAAWGRPLFRR
ncbi:S-layer homology domain-containing protein [Brachybacterium huguangmaarense]|uniref:S-layer homology domain-containing protein n=1 Tax=Brachybacterium huguangmaarense TaxID=1652028 RepID=UPI0037C12699